MSVFLVLACAVLVVAAETNAAPKLYYEAREVEFDLPADYDGMGRGI